MTLKLNHNATANKTKSEMEFKHKMGAMPLLGNALKGVTNTKTITDAGTMKVKYESNCCPGMKTSLTNEYNLNDKSNTGNTLEVTCILVLESKTEKTWKWSS